ncbi:hypothetical protein Ccrd_022325 [Cynara cardunculus var. scolymus]|uniref:Uncharacterized protein n=1 Tax=Cynara cardunculus var. scolymus TaxID=59895 RepID=A0A103XYX7_CYNCS|nr:hypothetical protein Ccrd_022325 [Cynara cardunculus var. scolymus]
MAHNQVEGYAQRKLFAAHWSMEAVAVALEKGDVFKSIFRVNAHNRVEQLQYVNYTINDMCALPRPTAKLMECRRRHCCSQS